MQVHELTPEQCGGILARTSVGHLACAKDGQPYVVPIHFSYDDQRHCLFALSSEGQKIAWMRANPKVCVEVSDVADKSHWTTVVVYGRYEEIGDSPSEATARQRVWDLFQKRQEWWLPAAAKLGPVERHSMVICRITIDRLTGRRASRGI
jgi:nitroimidazol reductase NimA-like FMN-containing flavoprotein (pyridoxamine 5'-phosphate oxidase superfamily)